jgi:dTDP-4-amino-4,6-dideoxygalactose transaminase
LADAVEKFESTFARWLGARAAFAFWKGRVALYAILRALGVGEGDEVLLPGYTCVMDVNPVKYLGAKARRATGRPRVESRPRTV